MHVSDIVVDTLTFPITTGQEEVRRDALETIEGTRRITNELPKCHTVVGLSNVSFGLKPALRHVINSVFLHECVEAGLDSAIVAPARILPMHRIDDEQRQVALDRYQRLLSIRRQAIAPLLPEISSGGRYSIHGATAVSVTWTAGSIGIGSARGGARHPTPGPPGGAPRPDAPGRERTDPSSRARRARGAADRAVEPARRRDEPRPHRRLLQDMPRPSRSKA